MTAWDPVGAGDVPEAWDEYDSYALSIVRLLQDAAHAEEQCSTVADHLTRIEVEAMGLAASEQRAREIFHVASLLVAWHEWSYTHGGRPPREWSTAD
jgi:hypothetical protein